MIVNYDGDAQMNDDITTFMAYPVSPDAPPIPIMETIVIDGDGANNTVIFGSTDTAQ